MCYCWFPLLYMLAVALCIEVVLCWVHIYLWLLYIYICGFPDILQLQTWPHSTFTVTLCLTTGAFCDPLWPFMFTLWMLRVLHTVNSITHVMIHASLVVFLSSKCFAVLPVFWYVYLASPKFYLSVMEERWQVWVSRMYFIHGDWLISVQWPSKRESNVELKNGSNCVPRSVLKLWKMSYVSKNAINFSSHFIEIVDLNSLSRVIFLARYPRNWQDKTFSQRREFIYDGFKPGKRHWGFQAVNQLRVHEDCCTPNVAYGQHWGLHSD